MRVRVTEIPYPSVLLVGDWSGLVYAISTISMDEEEHKRTVYAEVNKIVNTFDDKNHWSVSLREVRRELIRVRPERDELCTLVQFRIRDSY